MVIALILIAQMMVFYQNQAGRCRWEIGMFVMENGSSRGSRLSEVFFGDQIKAVNGVTKTGRCAGSGGDKSADDRRRKLGDTMP